MLIKGVTYVYSRVHLSSFEFTKPDYNHFAELIKTRRKCIVMNEDELVRSCWINSRSVWFGVYRKLNRRYSSWPTPFLVPLFWSPFGVERELNGTAMHICVTREMRAGFFHDAYVRHKTKITFNVSGLFISYHNILFGIECATTT